eukprot:TRINITY_DN29197_c0_g1_i1.p1 TRINITY_DN29197_c0_g1~~TRINITY_DN29197_c0_g1_i1.p1  ORF type:complete len:414 (-),score=71.19 TRINITY_DN29197_c0_g1_i1:9-1250(-)
MAMRAAWLLLPLAQGLDNGVGLLPPMGYNTWNDFSCSEKMSEQGVKDAATVLETSKLRDLGYRYVNLDDCWQDPAGRDPATGRLRAHPNRFPSGMPALAKYLHDRGFKFGIYTDRGSKTCAGRAGSLDHERMDAETFALWEVDYVKEDNCNAPYGANNQTELFKQFGLFRDELNRTGRPIFFSVCGGGDQGWYANLSYYAADARGAGALANAWRITSDVTSSGTYEYARNIDAGLARFSGPGAFNDPDMLLGSSPGAARRLSHQQSRTQFSLWAILMAPLLIGADLHRMTEYDLATYSNRDVIAVNQDPLTKQGTLLVEESSASIWGRPLADGSWAILFISDHMFQSQNVSCSSTCWDKLPFPRGSRLLARDLWENHSTMQVVAGSDFATEVAPWGSSRMMKLAVVTPVEIHV